MEEPSVSSVEEPMNKIKTSHKQSPVSSVEAGKTTKAAISATSNLLPTTGSIRKRGEPKSSSDSSSNVNKPTITASSRNSNSIPVIKRNGAGGVPGKSSTVKRQNSVITVAGKRTTASSDPVKRSLPELRRSSLPSAATKPVTRSSVSEVKKSQSVSATDKSLRSSTGSDVSRPETIKKPSVKPVLSVSSSSKKLSSTSLDSTDSSVGRKTVSKVNSPSARSPSVSSALRTNSLSKSLDRSSNLSGRRSMGTPESRDSRFIVLPRVEIKAGDDVRLDLRGHRVRSLNAGGLNLSPNLEFVYLRDNFLSTLEGIELLKRVKVLDLSFNEFKGPGFEPLENCKALQQLYLAGNQITSLTSLPQLPNLEFLSVAQNKLKSLSMASQPRLQVFAVSKNKITTLKGFPHLPVLEHLRVEENPILKMPHLEAASILLVGSTLKRFNDRDLSHEEVAISKRYPACTALCIRDGWEFCRPENAPDSTLRFLFEQWKDHFPPGYLLKGASVDQPFEEDACRSHFVFIQDTTSVDLELVLRYQWFVGERALSNFAAIPDATGQAYWPKHEDIDKFLKVECTPILEEIQYPAIFAISSPVSRGSGIPKVLNLEVRGELVEGNVIRGYAEVAWCGGTPGKGVASWLRRRWNSSPVVIAGAEDEEYRLTLDDIGLSLVFMYTPVTEEGAKGEPQYKYTDFVKAVRGEKLGFLYSR
uniref:AIR9-like A9 domain-containing protein n=1 Tax=Manihot esculenta TaxID=3983 RepID=A0A2C9UKN9_MANES